MREAAYGEKKAGGDNAKTGFGPGQIERAKGFKAREITAESRELIFNPDRNLLAVAPEIETACAKKAVAETR